jgi:hypothetical protein
LLRVTLPTGAHHGFIFNLYSSDPKVVVTHEQVVMRWGTIVHLIPLVTYPVLDPKFVSIIVAGNGYVGSTTIQVLPPLFPPPSGDLLVNGSFERPAAPTYGTRSLPGWRVVRGAVDILGPDRRAPATEYGNQSLVLAGTQGAATIEQSFVTEPGRLYTFFGWIARSVDVSVGRANVFLNDDFFVQLVHSNLPYAATTEEYLMWRQFSYLFRATSSITTLQLTNVSTPSGGAGGLVLDGLSVLAVDGPFPAWSLGTPAALTARASGPARIELTWLDTSADELAFEIHRRTEAEDWVWVAHVAPNRVLFTDLGVVPGVLYRYRVRAQNARGASPWSNEVSVVAP